MDDKLTSKYPADALMEGAKAMLTILFESYLRGYSFGRVVERFREVTGVRAVGEWEQLQTAGGLTVNNAIFAQVEQEGRA